MVQKVSFRIKYLIHPYRADSSLFTLIRLNQVYENKFINIVHTAIKIDSSNFLC